MRISRRVAELPRSGLDVVRARAAELVARGCDVIDLITSEPDHTPPESAGQELARAALLADANRAPNERGLAQLRRAVAHWYLDRHGVEVDGDTEVLVLPGAGSGLFHLPLVVCDPGDVVLVPDPSPPIYRMAAYLAGTEVVGVPLRPDAGWLPDLAAVPVALGQRARLLFLNYPNNPTGATASPAFFREVVAIARRHRWLICHDLSHGESGSGYRPASILEVEGAGDCAVEIVSWSHTFSLTGWRLAAVVGGREVLDALARVLSAARLWAAAPVQRAGAAVLTAVPPTGFLTARSESERARRDALVAALQSAGVSMRRDRTAPFLWVPCPQGRDSLGFSLWLLERAAIAVAPGIAFGAGGEGFVRIALATATAAAQEAAERLRALGPDGWGVAPASVAAPSGQAFVNRVDPGTWSGPAASLPQDATLGCL